MSVSAISPMQTFRNAMARAGKQIRSDGRAQCPGHDGEDFNLAVSEGTDGTLAVYCHSHECSADAICNGLGLTVADLFPGGSNNTGNNGRSKTAIEGKPVTVHPTSDAAVKALGWSLSERSLIPDKDAPPDFVWSYRTASGELVGKVVRWNTAKGKEIRQVSRHGAGWICRAMESPRPLYRLNEIAAASGTVYISEGEKAADAVASLGLLSTSPSQGSKSPHLTDWSPLDRFDTVVILPDHDEPGTKFAESVIGLLADQAPNPAVRVCHLWDDLPTLEKAGDAFDWSEHYDATPAETLKHQLESLPDHSDEYESTEPPEDPKSDAGETKRTFSGVPASELWGMADEPIEWLVDEILSADQPTIFGAKQKSLKTTLLTDLAVALATGLPWLNRFEIPRPQRTLLITGEASTKAAIRKIRRAADNRNVMASHIGDSIRVETANFPTLPRFDDCHAVNEAICEHGIEVVILDPLYMGLEGLNTANLTEVGPAMRRFMEHCRPAKVIIAHHVKKSASYDDAPNLEDLSQAGIAEFAGNYWLMGRMSEYQGDGRHELAVRYGGRDEQFGLLKLDFDERSWTADFTSLLDHREFQEQRRQNESIAKMKQRIRQSLQRHPSGLSESKLAEACATKAIRNTFQAAVSEMEAAGELTAIPEFKAGNRTCLGFRMAAVSDQLNQSGHVSELVSELSEPKR